MKIVIIGGGTAGWLSALMFKKIHGQDRDITVISSDEIGIIGAGEGSTGLLPQVVNNHLWDFGCNEEDFLKETESTIKLGIKHTNWTNENSSYFGPLDPTITYDTVIDLMQNRAIYKKLDIAETTSNGRCLLEGKTNFFKESKKGNLVNSNSHAYHFDGHKVGQYFKKVCLADGVKHIDAKIVDVKLNEHEWVESVVLDNGEVVDGWLFVDASGLSRLLMQKTLGVDWVSYADTLPVNKAMPFVLPHKDKIPNYTLAHALSAGWMWQIPTQSRLGCGYVYCDKYITDDEAQAEVEEVLGQKIEPIKFIEFESGRLEKFWHKNVLAVGLASAFSEPLEATSIHTTICQLYTFCNHYILRRDINLDTVEEYNKETARMFDDMKDFLSVHYLGKKDSSPFWKDIRDNIKLSKQTKKLLNDCKTKVPKHKDWEKYFGYVSSGLYNPVLYNLGIIKPLIAKKELAKAGWLKDADIMWEKEREFMDEHLPNLLTPEELHKLLNND
jgi:hypothetical protein